MTFDSGEESSDCFTDAPNKKRTEAKKRLRYVVQKFPDDFAFCQHAPEEKLPLFLTGWDLEAIVITLKDVFDATKKNKHDYNRFKKVIDVLLKLNASWGIPNCRDIKFQLKLFDKNLVQLDAWITSVQEKYSVVTGTQILNLRHFVKVWRKQLQTEYKTLADGHVKEFIRNKTLSEDVEASSGAPSGDASGTAPVSEAPSGTTPASGAVSEVNSCPGTPAIGSFSVQEGDQEEEAQRDYDFYEQSPRRTHTNGHLFQPQDMNLQNTQMDSPVVSSSSDYEDHTSFLDGPLDFPDTPLFGMN